MSDYSEAGAVPVEDAATDDPPTEAEVAAEQQRRYPDQARTAHHGDPPRVDPSSVSGPDERDAGGAGAR